MKLKDRNECRGRNKNGQHWYICRRCGEHQNYWHLPQYACDCCHAKSWYQVSPAVEREIDLAYETREIGLKMAQEDANIRGEIVKMQTPTKDNSLPLWGTLIQVCELILVVFLLFELNRIGRQQETILQRVSSDAIESVEVLEPSDLKGACNR